jgi:hypothetical protein
VADQEDSYSGPERRRFSKVQVLEATAAAVLAAAIIGTAGGVGWLIVQLPNRLRQLEDSLTRVLQNQDMFSDKFIDLEKQVQDHDRRIIKLELQ